jgi:hypothetical protein
MGNVFDEAWAIVQCKIVPLVQELRLANENINEVLDDGR